MLRQQATVYNSAPKGVSPPDTYYTTSSVISVAARSLTNRSSPDNTSSISEHSIVEKEELASISSHICTQLKTIVGLVGDFTRDVCEENESDADLLHELQNKVRPFLVNLDEEMNACERLIRLNIDNARISEDRVAWLLNFNKYQLEMRRMLRELSGTVYDDLERVLTLRHRGCLGVRPKKETVDNLYQMKLGMDRAEKLIGHERVNV
ncbi:hypothetical protein Tcan_04743 [Toxocara canis]|uniref:Uncharacterized protein n=1 Tax=Toxocara canis TaxID=6265 RepID=A0A0B2VUU3_TOXCA|nr:hypothetical protein Tcan_04743 [Toxocara canis]